MKLTDLAIIATVFFICLLVVIHVKGDLLHNQTVNNVMYNKVMDNITEEALAIGYSGVDREGYPVVSLDKIGSYVRITTNMYGGDDVCILCFVDRDGFLLCESNTGYIWSDKIYFSKYKETNHEEKVIELTNKVKETYGIDMSLPYNSGEKWGNSVDDYSLLIISYERAMGVFCFSGAKIHKR